MNTKRDETLEEIWAIRRQIAKKFGYDPRKQVAYYQRKQKASGARIYRPEVPAGLTSTPLMPCMTARRRKLPPASAPR